MSLNKYISMYTGYMRLYMFNNLSLLKLTGRCAFVFKMNYIIFHAIRCFLVFFPLKSVMCFLATVFLFINLFQFLENRECKG